MPESIIAAVATLIGAIGLKTFEWFLAKSNAKKAERAKQQKDMEDNRQLTITELRAELQGLEKKMQDLVDEVEEWKDKYWTLREQHVSRLAELEAALNKIKELSDESIKAAQAIQPVTG